MSDTLFSDYQQWLYPIARNLLGNDNDAEDLVQETMLKWLSMEARDVENVRAYLVRTLINKGLNMIRDRKREVRDLPWQGKVAQISPEVEDGPALSLGFVAMLERLSPTERAVFLLREVFGYAHREIAGLLGLSEENCRQLLSRARRHIRQGKTRFLVDPAQHLALYRRFVDVCRGEDLGALLDLLKEDIRIDVSRPAAVGQQRITGGLSAAEYVQVADPWPLNPDGELLLGLK
ncbi:MAG: sigma-70 family RNA polymerase sigma factor, partial [Bacteroidetes bacterium]